jgi:hypothetical protein
MLRSSFRSSCELHNRNDVTVALWIGHDNADGKRRALSGGSVRGRQAGVDVLSRVM